MKYLAFACLALAAAPAFTQSGNLAYNSTVTMLGTTGILSDVSGGHREATFDGKGFTNGFEALNLSFYPQDNGAFFTKLKGLFNPGGIIIFEYEVKSPRDASSGLPTGRRMHSPICWAQSMVLPTVNKLAPAATGPIVFSMGYDGREVSSNSEPGRAKQKAWLTSNFRLRLGDLPCSRIQQTGACTIVLEPDLDGDGASALIKVPGKIEIPNISDFTFMVPTQDIAPFIQEYQNTLSGQPTILPMTYEVMDNNKVVVTVESSVFITGIDDAMLLPQGGSGQYRVKVTDAYKYNHKGHVTVLK